MKRKTIQNKLDKLFSILVRSKGYCEKCGKRVDVQLQACHIYSRTYRSVRWELDNALCLCAGCHMKFHREPIDFVRWIQAKHPGRIERLLIKKQKIFKTSEENLIAKLGELTKLKEDLL